MKFHTTIKNNLCNASVCTKTEVKTYQKHIQLSQKKLEQCTLFSKLTSDSTRNNIIYLLYTFKALCVCDLANILNISIASVSQHLRKLYDKNMVTTRKEKQTIYYTLSNKNFIKYLTSLYEKN